MKERKESSNQSVNVAEFVVLAGERGLISKYLRASHEADALKRAIVERSEGLLELYTDFIRDEFSDTAEGTRHLHPRHKHSGRVKTHTERYEKTLKSLKSSEKRTLKYTKTTEGNMVKTENVRIYDPEKTNETFIYLNFTSGMFEMRDLFSVQNLIDGEPHVIPLTKEKNHENFSDILDVFTDEILVLQQLTEVEPVMGL